MEEMEAEKNRCRIVLRQGDLTKAPEAQVIVNAANSALLPGGGVCGAIFRAAGEQLVDACLQLGGCRPGQAKATPAFALPNEFIIHTVGPVWQGGLDGEKEVLADCYENSLEECLRLGCTRIAFPSVSTGIFGYPAAAAAHTALEQTLRFLEEHPGRMEMVEWVLFDEQTLAAYQKALADLMNE